MALTDLKPTPQATPAPQAGAWLATLRSRLGEGSVANDAATLSFFAQDVFRAGSALSAVIVPGEVADVQFAVKTLVDAGVPVIARGGGLSYTDGFLATQEPSAVLDLTKLNRLVELNAPDRYVTVETGMTWAALDQTLAPLGLRTPYWGPLSGLQSTIGGALSQGSVFLGSGQHGSVGDAVLGIDVVIADGTVLKTGSAAAGNSPPFLRYFGPDLTGLFVGDAGALGVKVRATLRLVERHADIDFLSYEYHDPLLMFAAMSEISRQGLAAECFAFDPVLAEQRKKRMSLFSDAKTLLSVVKQSGLKAGMDLVGAGRDFLGAGKYSAHVAIEGENKGMVAARMARAQAIFDTHGNQTENSFPKALRAMPFTAPNSMLGPAGERWVPVHAIFAHSTAAAAFAALQARFHQHEAELTRHQIRIGYLCTTVAAQGLLIEPVFYWPDRHTEYHKRVVEADYLKRCGEPDANPAATAYVSTLKREIADLMRELGGTHFQLGKFYTYRDGRNPAALALYDAIKAALDPKHMMNPGALR
jgi:FAD/FMN-containing dehydrogenase